MMRAGADPRSVVPYRGSANKNRRLIFYRCLEPARSFKKRENSEPAKRKTENFQWGKSGRTCAASVQKTQMQKDQKGREAIKGGEKKSPELAALATKSLFICVTRSELWVMQIKSSAEPASEHKGLLATHQHTQPAIRGGCDGNQRDLSVLQLRGGTSLTLSEETPGWLIVVVELRALCARERQKKEIVTHDRVICCVQEAHIAQVCASTAGGSTEQRSDSADKSV